GVAAEDQVYAYFRSRPKGLLDLVNVEYVLVRQGSPLARPEDTVVARALLDVDGDRYDLVKNAGARPRALLVHQARFVPDMDAAARDVPRLLEQGPETGTVVEGAPV